MLSKALPRFKAVWLMHAGLLVTLALGCAPHKPTPVASRQGTRLAVGPGAARDTSMGAMLALYRARMGTELQTTLGQVARRLTKAEPEGALGNLVADITFWAAQEAGLHPDFALNSNGGLRIPLEKGPVTVGHVYELMPFENEVVALAIDGRTVAKVFQVIAEKPSFSISNAQFTATPAGSAILINGAPLDSSRTYWLATNSYLAQGGDRMAMLQTASAQQMAKVTLRQAIINYIRKQTASGKAIDAQVEGRVNLPARKP